MSEAQFQFKLEAPAQDWGCESNMWSHTWTNPQIDLAACRKEKKKTKIENDIQVELNDSRVHPPKNSYINEEIYQLLNGTHMKTQRKFVVWLPDLAKSTIKLWCGSNFSKHRYISPFDRQNKPQLANSLVRTFAHWECACISCDWLSNFLWFLILFHCAHACKHILYLFFVENKKL